MSEKSDKLRAMLEKEKERRIKLNNRIEILERAFRRRIPPRSTRWCGLQRSRRNSLPPCCASLQLPPRPPAALSAVGATFNKEESDNEDDE